MLASVSFETHIQHLFYCIPVIAWACPEFDRPCQFYCWSFKRTLILWGMFTVEVKRLEGTMQLIGLSAGLVSVLLWKELADTFCGISIKFVCLIYIMCFWSQHCKKARLPQWFFQTFPFLRCFFSRWGSCGCDSFCFCSMFFSFGKSEPPTDLTIFTVFSVLLSCPSLHWVKE